MAEAGASGVLVADLNVEAAEEVVKGIQAVAHHPHFRAEAIKIDVSLEESVKAAVAYTVGLFGCIDYSIHCAGVSLGPTLQLLHSGLIWLTFDISDPWWNL